MAEKTCEMCESCKIPPSGVYCWCTHNSEWVLEDSRACEAWEASRKYKEEVFVNESCCPDW